MVPVFDKHYFTFDSRHASYQIWNVESDFIFIVAGELSKFDIKPGKPAIPIVGLDVVLWRWEKDGIKLEMSWDIWSGFSLDSKSEDGDVFLSTFASHLDQFLEELEQGK